ncbi:heat shock protein DnaJ, partial [Lophium mytilinum]
SYYEALGLVRTASKKDIVKAYRKKALTCHPDKVAPEFKDVAANLFKVITEAHDVLTDDALRVDYDR